MKKHILLPVLALAGGCAGFLLRSLQLTAAYDPYTRLFQTGSPFTLGLFGLVAVLAALYFLLLRDFVSMSGERKVAHRSLLRT